MAKKKGLSTSPEVLTPLKVRGLCWRNMSVPGPQRLFCDKVLCSWRRRKRDVGIIRMQECWVHDVYECTLKRLFMFSIASIRDVKNSKLFSHDTEWLHPYFLLKVTDRLSHAHWKNISQTVKRFLCTSSRDALSKTSKTWNRLKYINIQTICMYIYQVVIKTTVRRFTAYISAVLWVFVKISNSS